MKKVFLASVFFALIATPVFANEEASQAEAKPNIAAESARQGSSQEKMDKMEKTDGMSKMSDKDKMKKTDAMSDKKDGMSDGMKKQ